MRTTTALAGAGVAAVGVAAAVASRRRTAGVTASLRADLEAARPSERRLYTETYTRDDLDGLPEPVQRYLEYVLEEGQPRIRTATLSQRGDIRLGGPGSSWKPFTATEAVTTDPPGFVWDASVETAPFVPTRVVDASVDGRGTLRAWLLGAVPVVNQPPGAALDEGELVRYLAEAPLYPTALLPGQGLEWEPIDEASARATLSHGGTTVSAVFHVDERNQVDRVEAERPRAVDGDLERTRWTGRWRNYRDRDGMRVPLDGEVSWHPPDGEFTYWRGHLVDVEYRPALQRES